MTQDAACESCFTLALMPGRRCYSTRWHDSCPLQRLTYTQDDNRTRKKVWGVMELVLTDYVRSLMSQVAPWQAMLAGTLVGLLLVVLTVIIGEWLHLRRLALEAPTVGSIPPEEPRLTCVMCKEMVTMSTFREHVATHQSPRRV
jgi:hypothetical protein